MKTKQSKTKTRAPARRTASLRSGTLVNPSVARLLNEILEHQIANRGTEYAFYTCYTYPNGQMPRWVKKAERLLANTKPTGLQGPV